MRNKLTLNYVLTIRQEYATLIPLVAMEHGWDPQSSDKTAKEFLEDFSKEIFRKEMKLMIKQALDSYYGRSQKALIEQSMTDYDGSVQLTSQWEEIE